jgi:hypothetical protein
VTPIQVAMLGQTCALLTRYCRGEILPPAGNKLFPGGEGLALLLKELKPDFEFLEPDIIFICEIDEIQKKLYININNYYDLLHEVAHIEMLFINHGLKWKKMIVHGYILL